MILEQLRRLCDEATPGPWTIPGPADDTDDIIRGGDGQRVAGSCCCGGISERADEHFISASRTYMPLLLAVAEAAKFIDEENGGSIDGGVLRRALKALNEVSDET